MLTISKPLSASQARTYHAREFAAQEQNYWSRDPVSYTHLDVYKRQRYQQIGSVSENVRGSER